MTKQELIAAISPAVMKQNGKSAADVRAALETVSIADLQTLYQRQVAAGFINPQAPSKQELARMAEVAQALIDSEEQILQLQAERAAARAIHELEMSQAREPQRKAEDKRQLAEDRKTFLEACRQHRIGSTDANFSLIRTTLGPGFSVYEIGQAVRSGTLHLSPATPEEIQARTREAQEQRQQFLRNADLETLRGVVRSEAEQRRAQAQREDAERQIAHREMLDAQVGFPTLPEVNSSGEKIDAAYLIRISNTNLQLFKTLISRFGAANVTARLRGIR